MTYFNKAYYAQFFLVLEKYNKPIKTHSEKRTQIPTLLLLDSILAPDQIRPLTHLPINAVVTVLTVKDHCLNQIVYCML